MRRSINALVLTTSVIAVALMLIVAFGYLLRVETSSLIAVQTFTTYLFMPSYLIFLFAFATKRRLLAGTAAFLIFCHVFWVFPEFAPAKSLPSEIADAPKITLYSHNILWDNKTPDAIAAAIERRNPDIVFLQEFSYRDFEVLRKSQAFTMYPHKQMAPGGGPEGIATWSKFPLIEKEVARFPGFPSLRAVADVNGRALVLWNVHVHAPLGGNSQVKDWKGDIVGLRERLRQESGDVIIAGDFNATWTHRRYQDLLKNGYHDAHVDRGQGNARTWPVNDMIGDKTRGLIRIDHAIASRDVVVTRIEEDPGNGSDHRALIVELAVTG